jgi:hypothetical protein
LIYITAGDCSFARQTVESLMFAGLGAECRVDIHRLIHRNSGQNVKAQ